MKNPNTGSGANPEKDPNTAPGGRPGRGNPNVRIFSLAREKEILTRPWAAGRGVENLMLEFPAGPAKKH